MYPSGAWLNLDATRLSASSQQHSIRHVRNARSTPRESEKVTPCSFNCAQNVRKSTQSANGDAPGSQ
jgi:hypothetical protein